MKKTFKFKIEEPHNKMFSTIITLKGWKKYVEQCTLEGNRYVDSLHKTSVIQCQWWPWLYRRGIRKAKEKLIKRYIRHHTPFLNKVWTETMEVQHE